MKELRIFSSRFIRKTFRFLFISIFIAVIANLTSIKVNSQDISNSPPDLSAALINVAPDNIINVGVRSSAKPLAHNITTKRVDGYCGAFTERLKEIINDPNYTFRFHLIGNEYNTRNHPRFHGVKNGTLAYECGTNSISIADSLVAEGVQFSEPFYETGIKFLMKRDLFDQINSSPKTLEENMRPVVVGVVDNTTTIERLYGLRGINVKPYETRKKLFDDFLAEENSNLVIASDAPIIRTMKKEGLIVRSGTEEESISMEDLIGYEIYPISSGHYITQNPTEKYGIVVKDDRQLDPFLNLINQVIAESYTEGTNLYREKQNIYDFENPKDISGKPFEGYGDAPSTSKMTLMQKLNFFFKK